MTLKNPVKICIALIVIFINIGCDQITKEKIRDTMVDKEVIQIVENHFILTKVENKGAALGLFANFPPVFKTMLLKIFPLLVLFSIFGYILKEVKIPTILLVGLSFIIGGGIGNIYDRILYNSVTDFMFIEFGSFHTGIFNMADVSIVVGTLFILFNYLIISLRKKYAQIKSN